MRLLHHDRSTGVYRLRLETPSDLWRIARLVRPGDRVGASTTRRDPEAPEDVAGAERARRRVFLTVRAEQIEFHGFSKHVRITGPILEGPFDIVYLDPPYNDPVPLQLFRLLRERKLLAPDAVVVYEHAAKRILPDIPGYRSVREEVYGDVALAFLASES